MDIAETKLRMKKIRTHYKLQIKSNEYLLSIDKIIRGNAKSFNVDSIQQQATFKFFDCADQNEESIIIVRLVKFILSKIDSEKIAILIKQRGRNTDLILEILEKNNIEYFYALFTDDDQDYIRFHGVVKNEFVRLLSDHKSFNKILSARLIKSVKEKYKSSNSKYSNSLVILLKHS